MVIKTSFFRNKEIKRLLLLFVVFSVIITVTGFFISFITGIFSFAVCVVWNILFFIFTKSRYNKINDLCEQIDIVLHGSNVLDIDTCREGELSILKNEIYKMTVVLREQSDKLKSDKIYLQDSIADISHQLKTPLTSINMIISFLSKDDLDEEKRLEYILELNALLSKIDWLITTLLKMSKIDAKTTSFKKEYTSVQELIKKASEPFLIPLEIRNIRLTADTADNINIICDPSWSAEAISNIIKNCIEHTNEHGEINISCVQSALYTQIIIKDNGKGINKDDLPHLFERFYRGQNAGSQSFGIGLALSKMIITQQNGTIKASNNKDGGACFTIKFYHAII